MNNVQQKKTNENQLIEVRYNLIESVVILEWLLDQGDFFFLN